MGLKEAVENADMTELSDLPKNVAGAMLTGVKNAIAEFNPFEELWAFIQIIMVESAVV